MFGQVVTNPFFPTQNDLVTITYDASQGNQSLESVSPVYIHCGLITDESSSSSDWQHVMGNWGVADPDFEMIDLGNNLHQFIFQLDTYFDLSPTEVVLELAFVFRNADGSIVGRSSTGEDIFHTVYNNTFAAGFVLPNSTPLIFDDTAVFDIVVASSANADFEITYNGVNLLTLTNTSVDTLSFDANAYGTGLHEFYMSATNGVGQVFDTLALIIQPEPEELSAPSGIVDGVNSTGDTEVTFRLFAPGKDFVYVLGDFNNWEYDLNYLMKKDPINNRFWLTVEGLNPNQEYRYQYSVDDEYLRVADVYSEKILDKYNDQYIPQGNYPDLIEYPSTKTNGTVSVFKINESDAHVWADASFVKPAKEKLIIYELLVRDFLESQSYEDLIDTLDYLEYIGINAIELMPVNEFEGNNSWGYNPSFYFAPDKNYGTKDQFKAFIDECHQRDIAVIMDIALNHSFGQNPQVQMYFDASAGEWGQPSAESPWFNQTATHDFNVGYDYNHESPYTQAFSKRVLKHWVENYHIDGFRLDLSKGFTQNYSIGNINAWSSYDQSRIDILTDYANYIWTTSPDAYFILEHFADNPEETVLANSGFMLWGNMSYNYAQASMGYGGDLTWGVHSQRGWNNPHLVTYMESHDEERIMYENKNFGNSSGSYYIQMSNTALARMELSFAFLIPIPGPKMMWQFGEMGYDYSIYHCENGTINEDCRTSAKPIRWDYLINPNRVKLLKVFKALNELKLNYEVFSTSDFNYDLGGTGKRIRLNSSEGNVVVIGNFGVDNIMLNPGFQHSGLWYDYFTGEVISVDDVNNQFLLTPGEYRLYTDFQLPAPDLSTTMNIGIEEELIVDHLSVYPNPAKDQLTISSKERITSIEVYGLDGKLLIQNDQVSNTLDVRQMLPGVYLLRIETANNIHSRKILIHE
jgi:1,4-alpha-glucan branching enzyme